MNCKPGDLARVVRPYLDESLLDRFVEVQRLATDGETLRTRGGEFCENTGPGGPGWIVDGNGDQFPLFIGDEFLRPIRDVDGADETLAWAGKPQAIDVPTARAVEFARR